ncbi:hypothetical protein [Glutamicibacter endophyticus]|uniref:hypothetical protein n=1 Tax=Glutamicibacter endophyticus TaxID=1522174 RepID=UPI003AEF37D8
MESRLSLLVGTKAVYTALACALPLFLVACTATPADPSVNSSTSNGTPGSSDGFSEAQAVYEAFDPARLTEFTEKRNEESSAANLVFVAQGLLGPDRALSIPKTQGADGKSLLVSYICRSSGEPGTTWGVDFSIDSEPLRSGIQSEACTENSVEMFTTRALSPTEWPDTLGSLGHVELAVSVFEVEGD